MTTLPAPIAAFRDRTNAGDTEGVLALFPADGVVEDWGRRFVGHTAIRGWSDEELVGAKGHLEITRVVSATAAEVSLGHVRITFSSCTFPSPAWPSRTIERAIR